MLVNKLIEKMVVMNEEIVISIIKIRGCHAIILISIIISLKRLIEGGTEMLIAIKMSHQNVRFGNDLVIPLNEIMFRVWYFIYMILTRRNNAAEDNPWATIMRIAPFSPVGESVNNLVRISPMWAIEEYAIRDFKSFCQMQFILVLIVPIRLILMIQGLRLLILGIKGVMRMIP
jgi:hypothetical protein